MGTIFQESGDGCSMLRLVRVALAAIALATSAGTAAAFSAFPTGFVRGSPARAANPRASATLSALRMGGGNVPRVPYKAPGEQGYQFLDIWTRLQRERIMYIGQDLDDEYANQMVAVLLCLAQEDNTKGVQMYFNCPGGEVRAGLAVYDTMINCKFDITTLNLGIAASISGWLCGAGTKGQRMALPNARFLLQNPKLEDMGLSQVLYGQASDVKIEAEEILRMRQKVYRGLMQFTGRDYETIRKDLTRDLYLTATEAVEYGLIDKMLLPLERSDADYKKYVGDESGIPGFGKI